MGDGRSQRVNKRLRKRLQLGVVLIAMLVLYFLGWSFWKRTNGRANWAKATEVRYGMSRAAAERLLGPPLRQRYVSHEGASIVSVVYSDAGWGSLFQSQEVVAVDYYDGRLWGARVKVVPGSEECSVLSISEKGTSVRQAWGRPVWRKVGDPVTAPFGPTSSGGGNWGW